MYASGSLKVSLMVDEASKTNEIRGESFLKEYFAGKVLDIGCGKDLVVPHAEAFDKKHGDANVIDEYKKAGSYDCVHSSHSLEHMRNVPDVLRRWWALVRPGGYMVLVVPEENLYEQGIFPSLFNKDHRATFRIATSASWSEKSYELRKLINSLEDSSLLSCAIHDHGYVHSLRASGVTTLGRWIYRLNKLRRKLFCLLLRPGHRFNKLCDRLAFRLGAPIDQTRWGALAQIQAVVRKRKRSAEAVSSRHNS